MYVFGCNKAFDQNGRKLFWELLKRNLPGIRLLINLYTNNVARVSWNGIHNKNFHVMNGVRQGGIVSPVLFCICCVRQVLDVILAICLGSLAFADDIAVLVSTPRAMRMRHLLYICEQYAKKFSIMLNATKSAWLYVTKNKQTHHKFVPQFSIGGQRILTGHMLYLPVWMTENNVLCYFWNRDPLHCVSKSSCL